MVSILKEYLISYRYKRNNMCVCVCVCVCLQTCVYRGVCVCVMWEFCFIKAEQVFPID